MIQSGESTICYGCGVCAIVCPQKIIRIGKSTNGFDVPFIDDKLACINCGLCEKVCSYLDSDIAKEDGFELKAYSAYNKDSHVRAKSTSGGIAIEIAKELNKDDYNLCGVEYDSKNKIAKHFVTNDIDEYQKSKGSKYIQSNTVEAFSTFKKDQKYVVFGTPCQIDSLRRYVLLKKWNDNFFFVDFFCHGVPSHNLWKKYIEVINDKFKISENTNILFRDKKNGWHNFTMGIYNEKNTFYSKLTSNDLFLSMFLGNYCLNKSCYTCKFRLGKSAADIRLGDLWGKKYQNNNEGISGVLSITEKGETLIKSISNTCIFKEESLDTIFAGQMKGDYPIPSNYDMIMDKLRGTNSLGKIYWRIGYAMWMKNFIPSGLKTIMKTILNR